ncbi:stemmadenine O-acetyltransferase-like [Andrographis paniculata]|uniref:stemmadenine O-acetyltransferase-like n=1 Tax=Andrographis paniculata TaxID=175694 RepID=UPI0021E6FE2E|nr:stemmadenine O-acetyltransferase-like [Andrographis paniculata]
MERVIVSSENIKPDSPTPSHLKTHKLSLLDQIMTPILLHVVLYFPPPSRTDNHNPQPDLDLFISETTHQLKKSLSLILTRFYPFAGRVNADDNGHSIDCSDQGVDFTVAKFPSDNLSDLLENPAINEILPRHLVPGAESIWQEMDPESRLLMIQVNYFKCRSIAIGVVFWHKVADATTITNFLFSWARANHVGSKQDGRGICPNYISQSLFPHRPELVQKPFSPSGILLTPKWSLKRYVFHSDTVISALQAKFSGSTKVEVVSAFLWKCFMSASLQNGKSHSFLINAVDLRRRARPPFPSDCFGNFVCLSPAVSENKEDDDDDVGADLIRKLRDAIRKIDDNYVSSLQGDGGLRSYGEKFSLMYSEIPEGSDHLWISSLCNFGAYGVDFGWGSPVWITPCCDTSGGLESLRYENTIWLMDTRIGDGIEAWVTLKEDYMPAFDRAMDELRDLVAAASNSNTIH